MLICFERLHDVEALFDCDADVIHDYTAGYLARVHKLINTIETREPEHDGFENLLVPLDRARTLVQVLTARLRVLQMAGVDEHVRMSIITELDTINNFEQKYIAYNSVVYKRISEYAQTNREQLTQAQQKFIHDTLVYFKLQGLELSPVQQEYIRELDADIAYYTNLFEKNIQEDRHKRYVTPYELKGVQPSYLKYVRRTVQGRYILYADTQILETSQLESTRKKFWQMAVTIGYPSNRECLEKVIALRDTLAQVLGYTSYAQLDITGQMAGSVEQVEQFLYALVQRAQRKAPQEIALLNSFKPTGVSLTDTHKIQPWDMLYLKNYYITQVLALDEAAIAEYFPFEHVLEYMLMFYAEFFAIEFKHIKGHFWHDTVQSLQVFAQDNSHSANTSAATSIGFILLDLYARPGKYLFTLEQSVSPSVKTQDCYYPGVSVILASFIPATAHRPVLLRYNEVASLFHEFGHALHTLLGAQPLALQSGTHVSRDFAELPSQVLQQWIKDPSLLAGMSKHYKTGKRMPDTLIHKLIESKNFDSADYILEQSYLALLSLYCFTEGRQKDIQALHEKLLRTVRITVEFSPEDHSYASFNHLLAYGAKYYSYLWSYIYALDIFSVMQERLASGMSLERVGKHYIDTIISKGGSESPEKLLQDFFSHL